MYSVGVDDTEVAARVTFLYEFKAQGEKFVEFGAGDTVRKQGFVTRARTAVIASEWPMCC